MPVRVFWLRLSSDIVVWLCWITTCSASSDFRLQSGVWIWPAVGLDSIVEGQESFDDLDFQHGQSSNRVRILCKWSCVHLGFSVPLWAQGLRCVLIRIMRSLFTFVVGECEHRLDVARLLSWSCSYKDWDPQLSRDAFIYRISMGLQYGPINWVLNQGRALGSFRLDGLLCIRLWIWFG